METERISERILKKCLFISILFLQFVFDFLFLIFCFISDCHVMLRDLPLSNWFLEYRRMGFVEHHETCLSLSFVRVMFEFVRDGTVLPCNVLFRRAVHRYKGTYIL